MLSEARLSVEQTAIPYSFWNFPLRQSSFLSTWSGLGCPTEGPLYSLTNAGSYSGLNSYKLIVRGSLSGKEHMHIIVKHEAFD